MRSMTKSSRIIDTLGLIDNRGIPYCVLRNFEFATGGQVHGDVDILIPEAERDLLDDLLREDGYYRYTGDTTHQTRYLTYVSEEREIITLDIYWGNPTYNGVPFLDGERVLANREQCNEIWVPADEDLFVELVFHSILNKNHYRDRYRRKLNNLRGLVAEPEVVDHARSVFGPKGEKAVKLALSGELDKTLDLKWSLVLTGVSRSPRAGLSLFRELIILREIERPTKSMLNRFIPASTPVIAILGPDGVGKSTTVEKVSEVFEKNGFDVRTSRLGVHSGATKILGTLRSLYNRVRGGSPNRLSGADQSDLRLGTRSSPLVTPVLLLDWLVRYISAQTSGADVIVADRFIHELPVYNDPGPLGQFIQLGEIGPFYGVVLTGDPETIAGRSEFDAESIAKFQDRLRDPDLRLVDTGRGPEDVADVVLDEGIKMVLEYMSNK